MQIRSQAAGTSVTGANATIAVINPDGTIDFTTQIASADVSALVNGTNNTSVRSVVSADGLGFYVAGDNFIRYVPMVKPFGGRIVLEVQPKLDKICRSLEGYDDYYTFGQQLPAFDVHAPLLTLPYIFKTRVESIPANVPYLSVDKPCADESTCAEAEPVSAAPRFTSLMFEATCVVRDAAC